MLALRVVSSNLKKHIGLFGAKVVIHVFWDLICSSLGIGFKANGSEQDFGARAFPQPETDFIDLI